MRGALMAGLALFVIVAISGCTHLVETQSGGLAHALRSDLCDDHRKSLLFFRSCGATKALDWPSVQAPMASGDAQPILVSEGYRFYVSDLHSLSIAIQVQFFVDGRATIRVATLKWNGKSFAVVEQRYDFLSQSEIADIKRMIDNSRYWDTWSAVKADHAVEPAYMCADQPTSDVEGYRPPAHLLVETHCDDDPVFSKFAKSLTELGRVRLSKGR